MNRFKTIEISLSVLVLATLVSIFAAPAEWISSQSATSPVGVAIGIGIWVLPVLLSCFVLYQMSGTRFRSTFFLLGGASVLILLLSAMNLHTVYRSEGLLTYEGEGVMVGPILTLIVACFLASLVLIRDAASQLK